MQIPKVNRKQIQKTKSLERTSQHDDRDITVQDATKMKTNNMRITENKDILIKVKIWHEMRDECMHLLSVAESKEWNQTHQCLQHGRVGTNKWTVDTIEQHYELVLVTTQL